MRFLATLLILIGLSVSTTAIAQSNQVFYTSKTRSQLDQLIINEHVFGRELVDIERRRSPAGVLSFDAIFAPVNGNVLTLIDDTEVNYDNFLNLIGGQFGRILDFEVDDDNGVWRFSMLFWQSGEIDVDRTVRSRRSRAAFRTLIEDQARSNYSLIDIEISTHNGALAYSGVWQSHPGQPRSVLYYDLLKTELGSIFNASLPRLAAGRVLAVERYLDPELGDYRFAVLVAQATGDGEHSGLGLNLGTINVQHSTYANAHTHLIGLNRYYLSDSTLRYDALWGPGQPALVDVAPIRRDDLPVSRGATLDNFIAGIDQNVARGDVLGLFGLNLRTRQSVGWRQDELLPLASVIKVPIHFRLYRDAGLGLVDPVVTTPFTSGAQNFDPWWVESRDAPGLGCVNRGGSFTLEHYAQGMMTVSDNSATGALLLRDGGLARQSYSLNDWLAGLDGIAQGWGPVIAIAELDRLSAWRGQWCPSGVCVPSHFSSRCQASSTRPTALANSMLQAPLSALEVYWRRELGSTDGCSATLPADGLLSNYFNPQPIPASCKDDGEEQFHDMGLNSATPRTLVLLYEAFANGTLVNASRRTDALNAMGETGALTLDGLFPQADEKYSKGGTKGTVFGRTHVVTDSSLLRIGNDWYVLVVLGKHLKTDSSILRQSRIGATDYRDLGMEMLRRIAPDLRQAATAPQLLSPTTVQAGDTVNLSLRLRNEGPGHAAGFRVALRLSVDNFISDADPLVATLDTAALNANAERTLALIGSVPAGLAAGSYFLGWRIDTPISGQPLTSRNGQVGEWDEHSTSNTGVLTGTTITVTATPLIFKNGFE
ncbi:MAG: serine hydrolase [Rhodanobacteraceae bacterium]|nr:serine hydrolase [Rhodanobacteraceae bacterium]